MQHMSRRDWLISALAAGVGSAFSSCMTATPPRDIEGFFTSFSDDWVRDDPDLATGTRYFTGAEQDALDRRLTPVTPEWRRARVTRAHAGLAELRSFARSTLTETQRVAADVMEWSLDSLVRGESYRDFEFPLQQMNGVNVNLVESFTVRRAINSERDAENYVAALAMVGRTLDDATAEAQRLAAKRVIPPDFILDATIRQMQIFIASPPGENPFVSTMVDKMNAVARSAMAKRAAACRGLRKRAWPTPGPDCTVLFPPSRFARAGIAARLIRTFPRL
jgi:uncharacterized protein (DUF885 family)